MAWKDDLERVLNRYYKEQMTTDAVVCMFSAIRNTNRVIAGHNDESVGVGVLQMLVDLTYGMENNAFFRVANAQIWPLFQAAVNAYVDSLTYADEAAQTPESDQKRRMELQGKAVSARDVIIEVALAALRIEQGGGVYRERSRAMRDELSALDDDAFEVAK